MTQLDAFIYFLEQMDLKMLNEILTEDISYCGTTKEIFLEKLGGVFEYNASLNNKTLAVQKSSKNPNYINFLCFDNKYWVNTLLVTHRNGTILSFLNKKRNDSHFKGNFRVYNDEEIGYVKTTELIMTQNVCKYAIDLISNTTLTTELIINWLKEYKYLYQELNDDNNDESVIENIKYLEEFVGLWEIMDYDKRLILNSALAEIALNEFDTTNEQEWIEKYSYTFHCELIPGNTCAEFLCDEKYRFKDRNTIFESKELFLVHKFTDLYFNLYSRFQ